MDAQVIIIHCFIPEGWFLKQQNYCHTTNTSLNLLRVRSPDTLQANLKTESLSFFLNTFFQIRTKSTQFNISLPNRLI